MEISKDKKGELVFQATPCLFLWLDNSRILKERDFLRIGLLRPKDDIAPLIYWAFSSMLFRGLLSCYVSPSKCFSSSTSNVLKVGDILTHTRIFSSEDVLEYSKVSHDANPLHFDSSFARRAGFEDRLVHGMLVASIFPHMISSHFPGAVYVSQSLNFKLPVYVGDKITGHVEAISLREQKKRYWANFKTKCFKDGEEVVIEGAAMAILPSDFNPDR